MVTTPPTIFLGKPSIFQKQAVGLEFLRQKVLEFQPKITPFLAGGLGFLLGGPLTALKTFGATALGVGILEASPIARKFVVTKLADPTQAGRFVGEQIEKIAKPPEDDKPFGERVKEGLKTAGLIGAGAVLVAGGVAIAKKVKEAKLPKISEIFPSKKAPVISPVSALPTLMEPTFTQIPGEIKPEPVKVQAVPSIKNTFNPCINIDIRNTGIKKTFKKEIILNCI